MIVATAGHVDHGKTSLIKQLTGVDTDRLEEEKRRGLSINLGFAYLPVSLDSSLQTEGSLPQAEGSIGFIDVPGHKRFINTMIAGVSSIDLGMLVVAADDGPMPQTLEHLDVMHLLGIKHYVVVITKIDRVDSARVETVREAVLALLLKVASEAEAKDTPVFEVSNITANGVPELLEFLNQRALAHQFKSVQGIFRLSIDRAFNLKGVGLVVTGTVTAGEISVGDSVQLLPKGTSLRVRNIHAQDQPVKKGWAGLRCALNIVGNIEKEEINLGDWLVGPGAAGVTSRFAARCELLTNAPVSLKHMTPVKLYIGAKHIAAKIHLLERCNENVQLHPGNSCLVQIITDAPISCCRGERFLLRDDSESFTLGGGMVLDPSASRLRKVQLEQMDYLAAMELADFAAALRQLVLNKQQIIDFTVFKQSWNIGDNEAKDILNNAGLLEKLRLLEVEKTCLAVSNDHWISMRQSIIEAVQVWHQTHPNDPGIKTGELKQHLHGSVNGQIFATLLRELMGDSEHAGVLGLASGLVKISGFNPGISSHAQKKWLGVEDILQNRGWQIPLVSELSNESGLSQKEISGILSSAVKSGHLHKVSKKRFALAQTLRELAEQVNSLAQTHNEFSAIDYKKQIETGRNFAIEILEYFDSIRFTQRRGNVRIVLDETLPEKVFK